MNNICTDCKYKKDEGCLKNKQPSNIGCFSYKKFKEKKKKRKCHYTKEVTITTSDGSTTTTKTGDNNFGLFGIFEVLGDILVLLFDVIIETIIEILD